MNFLLKELRRIINRFFGIGPYKLISFEEITKIEHDDKKYGID